jgi:hypothetical protein
MPDFVCLYCHKSIWLDARGWRHDYPGKMPICNFIPEPAEVNVCIAGNPAVNGKCGDIDCHCMSGAV